jgi:hypothetical protein
MKIIKITAEQFNRLLLKEASEKKVTFNYSIEMILAMGKILGLELKNYNLEVANKELKQESTYTKIKLILDDKEELNKIVDDLVNKGLIDADKKIKYDAEKIVDNYNSISKENGFECKLKHSEVINNILKNK